MARKRTTKKTPATEPPVYRFSPGGVEDGDAATREWHDQRCQLDPMRHEAMELLHAVAIRSDTVMILMIAKVFIQADAVGDTRLERRLSAALKKCEERSRKSGT